MEEYELIPQRPQQPGPCIVCGRTVNGSELPRAALVKGPAGKFGVCHRDCYPGGYRLIQRTHFRAGTRTKTRFNRHRLTV